MVGPCLTPSSRISLRCGCVGSPVREAPKARRNTTGSVRLDSRWVNRVVVRHSAVGHGPLVVLGSQASAAFVPRCVLAGVFLWGALQVPRNQSGNRVVG